jgi:DNA-binding NarL/FixJ family response regulator
MRSGGMTSDTCRRAERTVEWPDGGRHRTAPALRGIHDLGPDRFAALSARELEIVRVIARGCSNREIGDALAITEGAVKNYVSSILSKMGVRDRTRAVLKALESGVL